VRPRTPDDGAAALLAHELGELVFSREVPTGASMLDCLRLAWQEAQWEACRTYKRWGGQNGRNAYPVYRAAQDRADAAQDALAHCSLGPL
jgi:hypothetical protein